MAITQLFFQKGNFINTIQLDVIIEESASATAVITSNPVEQGADINDHVIVQPMTFSMVGVVSDLKIGVASRVGLIQEATISGTSYTQLTRPSKDAWADLLALHANKLPFTLVQNLKEYENALMETLFERQDKDTSKGLFFTATFKILNLVGENAVNVQQYNESDTADRSTPNVRGGLKQVA